MLGIVLLTSIGLTVQVRRIVISETMVATSSSLIALWWLALIIHATFKFWMDDWATSRDRMAREDETWNWKTIWVYGGTKSFQIFGILHVWLAFGLAYWIVWRLKWRHQKAAEDENGESEEAVIGEATPLTGWGRDRGSRAGNGEDRRFRVRLNGHWWDGAGAH